MNRVGFRALALIVVLMLGACGRAQQTSVSTAGGEWHEFDGTWIAAGTRQVIRLGGDRQASVAKYSGSLVLTGPARPAAGFRADAVVFDDTKTGGVGRAVWTDEHGDTVYSELREEILPAGSKIVGTIFGGTGRYAGATGTYEFSWRFLVETDDGNVQGQSTGLKGRIRVISSSASTRSGGSRS
jgi:hypothetical protein